MLSHFLLILKSKSSEFLPFALHEIFVLIELTLGHPGADSDGMNCSSRYGQIFLLNSFLKIFNINISSPTPFLFRKMMKI